MENLWTPWRMAYIKRDRSAGGDCVFCKMAGNPADDVAEYVFARSLHSFATLNKYPYNYGHVMILPLAHVSTPEDMKMDALTDMMRMANRTMTALRELAQPQGFNIGANIGEAAGAGIAAHYHFHIVPRWQGDANFMTSIAKTRTIPETLDNLYHDLKTTWDGLYGDSEDSG